MFHASWKASAAVTVFKEIDADGDGMLTVAELLAAVERTTGKPQPRVRLSALVERWDEDGDGKLSFPEFKNLLSYLDKGHNVQQEIAQAWARVQELLEQRDDLMRQVSAAQLSAAAAQAQLQSKASSSADGQTSALQGEERMQELRSQIIGSSLQTSKAQDELETLLIKQTVSVSSSRASYLRSLGEIIGPPPTDRRFETEYVELVNEWGVKQWADQLADMTSDEQRAYFEEVKEAYPDMYSPDWVAASNTEQLEVLLQDGWERSHAVPLLCVLEGVGAPLGRALVAGDPCYAATTYLVSDGLFAAAERQQDSPLPPSLYMGLQGDSGALVECDGQWSFLEQPDCNGFCGLTSATLITEAYCAPENFDDNGYCVRTTTEEGVEYMPVDSAVVRFDSTPADANGYHAAVMLTPTRGTFPPNTLFRLKQTIEAGYWEAPGGVYPNQRLLVVTATYRPPRTGLQVASEGGGKICGAAVTLRYGSRDEYIKGLTDIISLPVLTMQQEFERDMSWTDWQGATFTLRDEWAYVNGPAQPHTSTPGERDANNAGKLPADFLSQVNADIRTRRGKAAQAGMAQLPEEHAYLTLDEVLAVRLYSGPCYQPINAFLRAVGQLSGQFRRHTARDPAVTFTATVAHMCRAIRKLASVTTPAEASKPLYRGVRGELPRAFWVPDSQGMVAAVDVAFMSTSRNRQTPIQYMDSDSSNVLWVLKAKQQSDAAYHRGADIKSLSQFAHEDEVLFPPCSMLEALPIAKPKSPPKSSPTPPPPSPPKAANHSATDAAEAVGQATSEGLAVGETSSRKALVSIESREGRRRAISIPAVAEGQFQVLSKYEDGRAFLEVQVLPSFI